MMGDNSLGSRRSRLSRSDSSSSRDTRDTKMTATSSSNGSSAHLSTRMHPNLGGRCTPTSGASLLQERLRERKVESARQNRHDSIDMAHLKDREVQSSPIARDEKRPSSVGGKGMGVKGMEEQVSTLHKQNFDLKLELYHRRQRQETLEARLEAAEKQIADQAELQEINEQLLAELEKRDQAVEEAVGVIVALEDKVDRLMKEREGVRAFEADYESTYFRPGHDTEFPSLPPSFDDGPAQSAPSVPRMPSFLSEKSEGTEALRSLYLPMERVNSDADLPQLTEESGMNSPRLSVLSESSFVSIYGKKDSSPDDNTTSERDSPSPPRRHRTSESVEKWMEARPASVAPPLSHLQKRNSGLPNSQYLSINTILDSPLQRLEKLKNTLGKGQLRKASYSAAPQSQQAASRPATTRETNLTRRAGQPIIKDQDSFDNQRTLPPTPDTFSTDTLRLSQNPNTNKRMKDNSFLDSTTSIPSGKLLNVSIRPRSAGETVASKRTGHGRDTETQDDHTEAGSVSDFDSMCNVPMFPRPQRVKTPDLFTFGGADDSCDQQRRYTRTAHIPISGNATAERYRAVRRSTMTESQRSDDNIEKRTTRLTDDSLQHPSAALYPPDRRSSLAAPTKLRKAPTQQNQQPPTPTEAAPPTASPARNSKISRLSGRLFGRDSKSEAIPPSQLRMSVVRSPTYFPGGLGEEARATPPPIKRSRTGPGTQRPMSAGNGAPLGGRMLNEFGTYDGHENLAHGQTFEEPKNLAASVGSKKWFGITRGAGSLRRN